MCANRSSTWIMRWIKSKEQNTWIPYSMQDHQAKLWFGQTKLILICTASDEKGSQKIGTRASVIFPASKGANLHCSHNIEWLASVLHKKRCFSKLTTVWIGSKNWLNCVNERRIEEPTIIFDNAPAHCRVETLGVQYPHVQFLRLASYSYLLNPIELVWSILKTEIKSKLRERMPHLLNVVPNNGISMAGQRMAKIEGIANESVNVITPVKLMPFSNRVGKYYPAATRREDLKEMS